MKVTFLILVVAIGIASCSKRGAHYIDNSNEKRFSVEFFVPPSVGSPYTVGTPLLINVLMASKNVSVDHVDFTFSDQSTVLYQVRNVDTLIRASPILNDKLWNVQYSTGITYMIPASWAGKTVTLTALANGKSATGSFVVR